MASFHAYVGNVNNKVLREWRAPPAENRRERQEANLARPPKRSPDRPLFAVRLEAARVLTGLDMGQFAAAIGVEAETYRRYERGETEPNVATMQKIRKATGVSLDFLIAGIRPDNPQAA